MDKIIAGKRPRANDLIFKLEMQRQRLISLVQLGQYKNDVLFYNIGLCTGLLLALGHANADKIVDEWLKDAANNQKRGL